MLPVTSFKRVRNAELLPFFFLVVVSTVEYTTEEASVNSTLIKHDRIFLVVSRVASDSNDRVTSSRKLFET